MPDDVVESGDDFDPSDLDEEVAEEAQREEREADEPDERPARREAAPKSKVEEKPAPKKDEKKPDPKPKTYKVKANGKETEIPAEQVDAVAAALGIEPGAILRGTQMLRAGQERLRTAAEKEKAAQALAERLKKDPRAAVAEVLGEKGAADLAVQIVQDLMEAERLTPEQRRIRELEAEQAKTKAEREAETQKREQAEQDEYRQKVLTKLDAEIKGALESGKLPQDPYTVTRLAAAMQAHLEAGGDADDLSVADFLPLVRETMQKEHEAFLGKLSGEEIIARFPATADKVRKAYAARVEGRGRPPVKQPDPAEREERPAPRKFQSTSEVLSAFRHGRIGR